MDASHASLLGLFFLVAAVAVNVLATALLAVCPFFFEPAVMHVNHALRLTVILAWSYATWSLWIHHHGGKRPRWFDHLAGWKRTAQFFEPLARRIVMPTVKK